MEKKENTGTKLNVLLCNLVDYVRGDDRPLVFAVMQEITEYFEQELDKAREEVARFNDDEIGRIHQLMNDDKDKEQADRQLDLQIAYKLSELRIEDEKGSQIGTFKDGIMRSFTYENLIKLCNENSTSIDTDEIEIFVPYIFKAGAMEVAKELNEKYHGNKSVNIHTSAGRFLYLWGIRCGNKYAFSIGDNCKLEN